MHAAHSIGKLQYKTGNVCYPKFGLGKKSELAIGNQLFNYVLMAREFLWLFVLIFANKALAFAQSPRDEAIALLLKVESSTLNVSKDAAFPYHERVQFTTRWDPSQLNGRFVRDYFSHDGWRERYDLGDYVRLTIRNGGQNGEFRSAAFEPVRLDQLRRALNPETRFDSADVVKKVASRKVDGVELKCIEFEVTHGPSRYEMEACVNPENWTLSRLRQRTTQGPCAFECGLNETVWSNYVTFHDRLYPRHVIVRAKDTQIIEADIQFLEGADLNSATFRIPEGFESRKACDDTTPPRRIQGEAPSYPHRINQIRYEGSVLVQARVGADGHVQDAQVVHFPAYLGLPGLPPKQQNQDMDETLTSAVRKWTFEPAKCDGAPMVQNILIPFKAELAQ